MDSNRITIICKNNGKTVQVPVGANLSEIQLLTGAETKHQTIGALVNNKLMGLSMPIFRNYTVEFIDVSSRSGHRIYVRSLIFVLYKAARDVLGECRLRVEHPISTGYYFEISKDGKMISPEQLEAIKLRMREIIAADLRFKSFYRPTTEVEQMFREAGNISTANLLHYVKDYYSVYYTLDGLPDFYASLLVPSTGHLKNFDLSPYFDGFFLNVPSLENPDELGAAQQLKRTFDTFREYWSWCRIIGINDVADLNSAGRDQLNLLVKVAEALHEKKIVQIADRIASDRRIKVILIAGPSSSGKTTFSKRLSVQLAASGIMPVAISLDNYFVDRDKTPLDENGDHDFESLYALNLPLLYEDLDKLIRGEQVTPPIYNFETGKSQKGRMKIEPRPNQVFVLEGIHALNPELTKSLADETKFKIYVEPLTAISIDDHNWIPTEDTRMLRRIIRDHKYRSYSAADTILRWPSIRAGEEKWIRPFTENADAIFNSSLVFELPAIRKQAEPILSEVRQDSDAYPEARRLIKLLRFISPIAYNDIPSTSLLREFLGGSGFRY